MTEKLDMDRVIVNENGKPTSYFEDVISQIVDALGGEEERNVPDQIKLSEVQTAINRAQIKANR